jgi:hypothetical protein
MGGKEGRVQRGEREGEGKEGKVGERMGGRKGEGKGERGS